MNERPAYEIEAWFTGAKGVGPQCSSSSQFCFFCSFSEGVDECGHVANLKALVRLMVAQKKELSVIVDTVQQAYNDQVKDEVEFQNPSGQMLCRPAWSKKSISTHLVYSTEFPEIFNSVVTHIHQSLIMQLNREAISDGKVDQKIAEELRKMVQSLKKWQS